MYYYGNEDEMKYNQDLINKKVNSEKIEQIQFKDKLQNKIEKLKDVGVEFDEEGNVSEELLKKDKIIDAIYDFFCTEKVCLFNPSLMKKAIINLKGNVRDINDYIDNNFDELKYI